MSDSRDELDWLRYAEENLQMAQFGLERGLYNPCLQNVQQAVEKALKAALVRWIGLAPRTHSIRELCERLQEMGRSVGMDEDEIDLLDSIYLPSKYPPDSALASGMPNEAVCRQSLELARNIAATVRAMLDAD